MTFSLDSLALKDTTELQLRHPVTEELLWADKEQTKPVAIALYGPSSKQYRNAITAMQNRQLRRGKQKVSAETLREESVKLLVACSDSRCQSDGYRWCSPRQRGSLRSSVLRPEVLVGEGPSGCCPW
jgi:hypothetical protein